MYVPEFDFVCRLFVNTSWIRNSSRLATILNTLPPRKKRLEGHTQRPFVNSKQVIVKAGDGGDGCIAFERLFCNPKAGPSGGDGGNGAHVIFQANLNVSDLSHLPAIINGENGGDGHGSNCCGANGKHSYIQVPVGTQIYSLPKDEVEAPTPDPPCLSSQLIGTLKCQDDIFLAARGGAGGKGNAFLTSATMATDSLKIPTRKNTPLRIAERGAKGEQNRLLLRMSRLADFGLVGLPNAGKSTLLRRLTRARPKVAPYPFTTLHPHMGVMQLPESFDIDETQSGSEESRLSDRHQITIADLPGLIEGAAQHNRGLGSQFLSLIADCQLLAYVVDIGTLWNSSKSFSLLSDAIVEELTLLRNELIIYDDTLDDPSRVIVMGTKIDLILPTELSTSPNKCELLSQINQILFESACKSKVLDSNLIDKVIVVSARRGDNVPELLRVIRRHMLSSKSF